MVCVFAYSGMQAVALTAPFLQLLPAYPYTVYNQLEGGLHVLQCFTWCACCRCWQWGLEGWPLEEWPLG